MPRLDVVEYIRMKSILGLLVLASSFLMSGVTFAQGTGTSGGGGGTGTSGGGFPSGCGPQPDGSVIVCNALGEGSTFYDLIDRFIQVMTVFAVPILVALIIIAGFLYLFGGADPSKRATATNIIKYGIIGFIVIIFARAIVAIVQGVIS